MQLSFNHKEGEIEKGGFVFLFAFAFGPRPYHIFEFWEALKCSPYWAWGEW